MEGQIYLLTFTLHVEIRYMYVLWEIVKTVQQQCPKAPSPQRMYNIVYISKSIYVEIGLVFPI